MKKSSPSSMRCRQSLKMRRRQGRRADRDRLHGHGRHDQRAHGSRHELRQDHAGGHGKQVTVVGESNGWYQVTFGSTTGWLLGEYLRRSCRPRRHSGRKGRLHGDALSLGIRAGLRPGGGASPNGFDCRPRCISMQKLGYSLPHSVTAQYKNRITPSPNPGLAAR